MPRGQEEAVVLIEPDAATENGGLITSGPPSAEKEPNDTVAQSQQVYLAPWPLSPGAAVAGISQALSAGASWSVQGTLATRSDIDSFRLILVPTNGFPADGGSVSDPLPDAGFVEASGVFATVAIELAPAASAADGVGIMLQGRVVGGGRVLQMSTAREPVKIPNAGLVAGSDLILTVTRVGKKNEKASANPSGPMAYRLTVTAEAPLEGQEMEPNSDPGQATPLHSSTATLEAVGYLGWKQDTDWFALHFPTMPPDTVLAIDLQLPTDGVGLLAVAADAAGKVLHGYTQGTPGNLQLNGIAVPVAGPLLVKVQNAGPAILSQRYRLTASAVHREEGFELEPNELPSDASPALSDRMVGFIHPEADADTFKVCGHSGMTLLVQSPARLDLVVSVLDESGKLILATAAPRGNSTPLAPLPVAPCCFIQIRENSGKLSNVLEPYVLKCQP